MQFKILPYLEILRVLIPPSTCIIYVSSATHEKHEIKNTSKFSTRTVSRNKMYYAITTCQDNQDVLFLYGGLSCLKLIKAWVYNHVEAVTTI